MTITDTIRALDTADPGACDDLLWEVGQKNRVRVSVTRAHKKPDLVSDSLLGESVIRATPEMLRQLDGLRLANGLTAKYLPELYRIAGRSLLGVRYNLRTTVGADYCAAQLGGSASTTVAKYIAVSNNTNAASAANTATNTNTARICWGTATSTDAAASTSRGEYTALGFARAAATYAHTASTSSFTQTITFTATGAATNLQCCGIFDNATQNNGTLFCENTYTATTFATNDQLTITWTMNL